MNLAMVEEAPPSPNEDSRRRYYRLTGLGRRTLTAEIARLDTVVREARLRLRVPNPRRAS
jgi:DNA-binding PadR family transcriptional regulator